MTTRKLRRGGAGFNVAQRDFLDWPDFYQYNKVMKDNHLLYTVSFLLLPFIFSCQGGPRSVPRDGGNAEFPSRTIEKDIITPRKTGRISVSLSLLVLPEEGNLSPLLKKLLYDGMNCEQYAEGIIASLRKNSAAMEEAQPGVEGEDGDESRWYYTEAFTPVRETSDPDILVISHKREYYLGGAHGMREGRYFAVRCSRKAALSPGDFVPPEKNGAFLSLIEEALREYSEIKPGARLTEGGFFKDTLEEIPDNFYPGRRGMVFGWDPYEIAPFSMGPIEVTVPWEKIRALP
jgi:hypothetical protein